MTPADIHAHFDLQRQASRAHVDVPLLVRRERLLRQQTLLATNGRRAGSAPATLSGVLQPQLQLKRRKQKL